MALVFEDLIETYTAAMAFLSLAESRKARLNITIDPKSKMIIVGDGENSAGENWMGDGFLPALLKATARHLAMRKD